MKKKSQVHAFTLVEIMIVVVIVGMIAAMAAPTFAKIRQQATLSMMTNDARQLSSGAQQYFMETGAMEIRFTAAKDGTIDGAMNAYVSKIGPNYTSVSEVITEGLPFSLSHNGYNDGDPVFFHEDGGLVQNP